SFSASRLLPERAPPRMSSGTARLLFAKSTELPQEARIQVLLHLIGQAFDVAFAQVVVVHRLHDGQSCPTKNGSRGAGRFEQTMQVGADDLAIGTSRAIGTAVVEHNGRIC